VKTGTNTLQFTYLMAWWYRNCTTLQVVKFYFV